MTYDSRGREMGEEGCRYWLVDHNSSIDRYLRERWTDQDYNDMFGWILENPKDVVPFMMDYRKSDDTKIEIVIDILSKLKGTVLLVIGAKGSGKTAFGFWCAEEVHKRGKEVYLISPFPEIGLPEWIHHAFVADDVPENAFMIMDEAGLQIPARTSASERQQIIQQQLAILRHGNRNVLFATQHSKLSDVNLLRFVDVIVMKPLSLLQEKTERTELHDILFYKPNRVDRTTFISLSLAKHMITQFTQPLPSFWNDDVSKQWRRLTDEKVAIQFCNNAIHGGYSMKAVAKLLKVRGFLKDVVWVKSILTPENLEKVKRTKDPESQKEEKEEKVKSNNKLGKPLTQTEQNIHDLKQKGYDNITIAKTLDLSPSSIPVYLSAIRSKGALKSK